MWYTALLIGITGSLHCAGMCTPLLMAVTNLTSSVITNRLLYNGGRILTYGILGSVFSGAGSLLPISPYQSLLSLLFGAALIVMAFFRFGHFKIPLLQRGITQLTTFLKERFAFLLSKKSFLSVFIMGTLNGFLPCGMTLIALSYCLVLAGPLDGFNFMLLFGVGTLPVMLGFAPLLLMGIRKLNFSIQKATTVMMICSGAILVARVFIYASVEAGLRDVGMMDVVLCR
ncbi:MAG TPA: sulfite exporter TauE/SafE family protein [Chryseolinea sp.]